MCFNLLVDAILMDNLPWKVADTDFIYTIQ